MILPIDPLLNFWFPSFFCLYLKFRKVFRSIRAFAVSQKTMGGIGPTSDEFPVSESPSNSGMGNSSELGLLQKAFGGDPIFDLNLFLFNIDHFV